MLRWTAGNDREQVARLVGDALAAFELADDDLGLAYSLWVASLFAADPDTARDYSDRSAALFRANASPFGLAHCLEGRALIELAAGNASAAVDPLQEVLAIVSDIRNPGCAAHTMEATAAVLADRGDLLDAGRLIGAAAHLRAEVGQDHRPWEREGLARTARAFAASPSVELDLTIAEGRALDLDAAVSFAQTSLEGCRTAATGVPDGPAPLSPLTKREQEVLTLLVEGHTNREIAEGLFVSVKTVERHLGDLYRKLGVGNRTQATTYALRHGLGRTTS